MPDLGAASVDHEFWVGWERMADDALAMLRTEAGRDPCDRALTCPVDELSTRSTRSPQ